MILTEEVVTSSKTNLQAAGSEPSASYKNNIMSKINETEKVRNLSPSPQNI